MFKRLNKTNVIFIIIDVGLTLLALGLAKLMRVTIPIGVPLGDQPLPFSYWLYVIVAVIWIVVFTSFEIYSPVRSLHRRRNLLSVWGAVTAATFTFAGVSYMTFRDLSRLLFVYFYVLDVAFLYGWRWLLYSFPKFNKQLYGTDERRILIVGTALKGQQLAQAIAAHPASNLTVVGFVKYQPQETDQEMQEFPILGTADEVPHLVEAYNLQEVIFAVSPAQLRELRRLIMKLQNTSVTLRLIPDAFDLVVLRGTVEDFEGIPVVALTEFPF